MKFDFQQDAYLIEDTKWLGRREELQSPIEVPSKTDHLEQQYLWNHEPGYPMVSCEICDVHVKQALYDSGSDMSIMSLELFNKINYPTMTSTDIQLQLANSTMCQPEGIVWYVESKFKMPMWPWILLLSRQQVRMIFHLSRETLLENHKSS